MKYQKGSKEKSARNPAGNFSVSQWGSPLLIELTAGTAKNPPLTKLKKILLQFVQKS